MRFMHDHNIRPEAQRAIALASYHHAQANPRAVMHGRPLTEEDYDDSRWIVEPFRLFDCCMENDGAAALVLISAERARDLNHPPAYVLGGGAGLGLPQRGAGAQRADLRVVQLQDGGAAPVRAWPASGRRTCDVVQSYENFTGGVLMSLVEHGFCRRRGGQRVPDARQPDRADGRLPLNTSGGNLAECYMHGLELQIEAVRQLRGQSTSQVPGAQVAMVISGPMVTPVSSMILGSQDTL